MRALTIFPCQMHVRKETSSPALFSPSIKLREVLDSGPSCHFFPCLFPPFLLSPSPLPSPPFFLILSLICFLASVARVVTPPNQFFDSANQIEQFANVIARLNVHPFFPSPSHRRTHSFPSQLLRPVLLFLFSTLSFSSLGE